jgi:hypothetical protein
MANLSEMSLQEEVWAASELRRREITHEANAGHCYGKSKAVKYDRTKVNGQILFLLSCFCSALVTPPRYQEQEQPVELEETKVAIYKRWYSGVERWQVMKLFFHDDFTYQWKRVAEFYSKEGAQRFVADYIQHPSTEGGTR